MIEHLYLALKRPYGSRLKTDDPNFCVQKLHEARRKAADPALDKLTIAISRTSPDDEVWLVHQGQTTEPPSAEEE